MVLKRFAGGQEFVDINLVADIPDELWGIEDLAAATCSIPQRQVRLGCQPPDLCHKL